MSSKLHSEAIDQTRSGEEVMESVAILGAYAWKGQRYPGRLEDMVFEAASGALRDAGLSREKIDNVVLSASDELDGRSISSMLTSAPAGGLLKDVVKVTDSGLHAVAIGAMRIQSHLFETGLVISWSKTSESSIHDVQRTALDPFVQRPIGVVDPITTALAASSYFEASGRDVAALDRRAAGRGLWPLGQATASEMVSFPIRRSHLVPPVDGVAAVVLGSKGSAASQPSDTPRIWIRGIGWATDGYSIAERQLTSWPSLTRATQDALRRAGLKLGDLDAVEVDDRSVLDEALAIEAIGFAQQGMGFERLSSEQGPQINRLTQCGLDGYPHFCSGLWRLAQVTLAARRGGIHRVLVHGSAGQGAQVHAVVVCEVDQEFGGG